MTTDLTTSGRRYGAQTAEERHSGRRARLLEAALDTFGTAGFAETSIGQLCAQAKVSTRNFYEHFNSREALLIELHDEINAQALTAVATAISAVDPADLGARARAGVAAYLGVMTTDRRRARIALIESVGLSRHTEQHRQVAIARFAAVIELEANRLAAAGIVSPRDFKLIAVALVGAINGLVNTWGTDPGWNPEQIVEVAAGLIVTVLAG